jgi:hypothetical protein
MIVDCDHCAGRAVRCDTCVVGLLLGPMAPRQGTAQSQGDSQAASVAGGPGAGPPSARRREPDRAHDRRAARSEVSAPTRSQVFDEAAAGPVVEVDPRTALPTDFDTAERRALAALAGAGLIAPLRLTKDRQADTNSIYRLTERHSLAG